MAEKLAYFELKIDGKRDGRPLSPANFDIRDLAALLKNVENLLYPNSKKDRPTISLEIHEGSFAPRFLTLAQAVFSANALLGQIKTEKNLGFLMPQTAEAIEYFQSLSKKNGWAIALGAWRFSDAPLVIDPTTEFEKTENWTEADFFFYGEVQDAGGKTSPNLHLQTDDHGLLKIQARKAQLAEIESNLLYKTVGVRASGRQNVKNGDIDLASLALIEFTEFEKNTPSDYLDSLIEKSKLSWAGVEDADAWLESIRN